ncbi:MAG: site-specific integrase [Magnetococcus sp. YQC-9]
MALKFSQLTRPATRKLQSGQSVMEHGIHFERLPNGDGRFTVNIMVDGQRVHRVIGKESDGVTRQQAEDFIQMIRTDARKGRLNLPKGRKVAMGFRDAAGKYLFKLAEEGGRDLVMKRRRLNLHLVPFFGDATLSKISTFDVEWIDKRPAQIRRFREEKGRITYLTVEQVKRLVDVAKGDQNAQVYPFIVIGVETSMRMMEILSIQREHVDVARRVIWIPQAKGGAREQPITGHLANFLTDHMSALPSGTPWLFPSVSARDGHTVNIVKAFRRVVDAAGLDPNQVVRHTLRHTAITHLVQAGIDLPTVKRISGHKTLAMVERYSHQNGEHIKAAMNRLDERYRLAGEGDSSGRVTQELHIQETGQARA